MNKKERVAELVRQKRTGMNLSQAALAYYLSLGLPQIIRKTHVSKWETGQSMPSIWMAVAIKATATESDGLPEGWVKQFATELISILLESDNGKSRASREMPTP